MILAWILIVTFGSGLLAWLLLPIVSGLVKSFISQSQLEDYYRDQGREVDASIALDGLVANEELNATYQEVKRR